MQTHDTSRAILDILANHLAQIKSAYYAQMPGVTYDDMAAAAERLLRMRVSFEQASGRKVTTKVNRARIAALLR